MKKLNYDKKNGITLVSLVVTIVVLLILAGVSISTLVGENGIVDNAKKTQNNTYYQIASEEVKQLVLEYKLSKEDETLEEFLASKVPTRIDGVRRKDDNTLIVKKNGYEIEVEAKAEDKTLTLTVVPYIGTYDGQPHDVLTSVNVSPSDAKVEYSTDGINYSTIMPTVTNSSSFTVTVRASKAGYKTQSTTQTVKVNKANGSLSLSSYSGTIIYQNSTSFTVSGNTGALSASSSNTNIATVSVSGNTVTVKSVGVGSATITVKSASNTNYNEKTETYTVTVDQYKIGDYVNYTYDTAENYVLTSATCGSSSNPTAGIPQTKGLKWRILNIDEANGTVDLISENPTRTSVYFSNILGYNNGPYLMNEICKAQYSNKKLGVNARSINLLDMEKHLTTEGIVARNAYKYSSDTAQYGTTETYTSDTKYPSLYKGQKGAGVNIAEKDASKKIAQPEITKGNDPYEESKPIATTEPTKDDTSGTGNPLTVTQTYYYIPIDATNYGDAGSVLSSNSTFWVASRYVTTYSDCVCFGLRGAQRVTVGSHVFRSDGYISFPIDRYGLRPVVSLPYNILSETKDASGAWNLK